MGSVSPAAWWLCLAWASGPADWVDEPTAGPAPPSEVVLPLPQTLQLSWTHSIERVRWQEWYTPSLPPHALGWQAQRVRVLGSGAGMEPAPDAVWHAGGYEWTPQAPPLAALHLMASPYVADYTLCLDEQCRPLRRWLDGATASAQGTATVVPSAAAMAVRLRPCRATAPTPPAANRSD